MYCSKCGNELREGATFCDKCGTKVGKGTKGGRTLLIIAIVVAVIGIACLCAAIFMMNKTDSSTETPAYQTLTSAVNETQIETKKVEKITLFKGEAELELPSFVSFSKERMALGNYEEAKSAGGYVQFFEAGSDISVVQCMAEYKDLLSSYGVSVSGTLSSNDGEYNYTCYTCTYTGDAGIDLQTINFNDSGVCDMCFVVATKDGNAYIAAYVPKGVTFTETGDHMKNSY